MTSSADLPRINIPSTLVIGGGSSIDCAKAMSVTSRNEGAIAGYMGYHKIPKAGVPLIAINSYKKCNRR